MKKLTRLGAALTAAAVLATGCGGGGAGAGGGAAPGVIGADANTAVADVLVVADKDTLSTAADSTVTLTAQVKDARSNVLPNQAVGFSTTDRDVALEPGPSPRTDAAGKVVWTLRIGTGAASKTRRAIPVTVTAGGVTKTIEVNVAAPNVKLDGPESIPVGTTADYTLTMLDDANAGIAGVTVVPVSRLGNAVTVLDAQGRVPAAGETVASPANGQLKVRLSGTTAGDDVLSVPVLGVTIEKPVKVISAVTGPIVQFATPGASQDIVIDTQQAVTVRFTNANAPQAGRTVLFSTTRGRFVSSGGTTASAVTDANGEATVHVTSESAGSATLTAIVQGGTGSAPTATRTAAFVSVTPAKVSLSPSPSSIAVNAPGSSSSVSQLTAVVRDARDNAVKGAVVVFSAPVDPSGGRIEPAIAVTDEAGRATVSFVAGPQSTGPNGVTIRAAVADAPTILADQRMTVSAAALFIELGTGNTIEAVDATTYSMPWVAIVTDANRNPVVGARVTPTLVARKFHKGVWAWSGSWITRGLANLGATPAGLPAECLSEDTNNNNLLDQGEDRDGDGKLDPGSPAAVAVTSTDGVTGSDGRATLAIVYPKSFARWVDVELRVTIGTSGTESSVVRPFRLPVLASDVQSEQTAPPNVNQVVGGYLVGPYGWAPDCSNPN